MNSHPRLAVVDLSEHAGDLLLDCEVVVVGTGAGGAVVATELALAGHQVVMLEEGKYVSAAEHGAMRPSESLRHLWRDGAASFVLGLGDTPAINLTMGRVVGGSSMVTGAVCFRTPEHILHTWVKDLGLDEMSVDRLTPYFEAVEKAAHIGEVPAQMRSRSTTLFGEGLAKHGHQLVPTRRNTRGCHGCGRCNFGCPEQAKMSVDLAYLPRAQEKGVEIYSRCIVDRVDLEGERAVGVSGRLLNGKGGSAYGQLRVRARRVVLAAGAAHTPMILRKSGIGGRSRQVGRNMTLHPSFRVFAHFKEPVRGWEGALQSAYTDAYLDERLTLMSLFLPVGVFAATMPGVGPLQRERAKEIPHLALFGGLIHDDGGGRVWPGIGREPLLTYRMSAADRAAVPRAIRRLGEIFLAAGADKLYLPVLGMEPVDADAFRRFDLEHVAGRHLEASSQHPLGTTRIGVDPKTSVVDQNGKCWDTEELFIADGGIVPTSLGVNPQQTIMALATKVAWHLRDRPYAAG